MAGKRSLVRGSAAPQRPVVTSIKVDITYPDGSVATRSIDPANTEALFWTDHAVVDVLGCYYAHSHPKMSRAELGKRFGKAREKQLRQGDPLSIEQQDIRKLWGTPGDDGLLLALMEKDPRCSPK